MALAERSPAPEVAPESSDPGRASSSVRAVGDWAALCWGAFLSACGAPLLAFALIDPGRLGAASEVLGEVDRMAGYGVGFLFFWCVGLVSGGLTLVLTRRSQHGVGRPESTAHHGDQAVE